MKTATLPSLRVEPELREKAEAVLEEGETLSLFIEKAVRRQIHKRTVEKDFLAKALAAEAEMEATGISYSAEEVVKELEAMLERAEAEAGTRAAS